MPNFPLNLPRNQPSKTQRKSWEYQVRRCLVPLRRVFASEWQYWHWRCGPCCNLRRKVLFYGVGSSHISIAEMCCLSSSSREHLRFIIATSSIMRLLLGFCSCLSVIAMGQVYDDCRIKVQTPSSLVRCLCGLRSACTHVISATTVATVIITTCSRRFAPSATVTV